MIIAEDLLLLAYNDESGATERWAAEYLDYRLAGALLIELALAGRVEVTDTETIGPDGKRIKAGRVVVVDGSPTGHGELDNALRVVTGRPRKPSDLIHPLAKGVKARLLEGLAQRGVLRRERGRALGVFPATRWPAADSTYESALRRRLEQVLTAGATPTPAEAALLALGQGSSLVKNLVPKDQRKDAEARAKAIRQADWASAATKKAIDDTTAAILVAVILPATMSAASS